MTSLSQGEPGTGRCFQSALLRTSVFSRVLGSPLAASGLAATVGSRGTWRWLSKLPRRLDQGPGSGCLCIQWVPLTSPREQITSTPAHSHHLSQLNHINELTLQSQIGTTKIMRIILLGDEKSKVSKTWSQYFRNVSSH